LLSLLYSGYTCDLICYICDSYPLSFASAVLAICDCYLCFTAAIFAIFLLSRSGRCFQEPRTNFIANTAPLEQRSSRWERRRVTIVKRNKYPAKKAEKPSPGPIDLAPLSDEESVAAPTYPAYAFPNVPLPCQTRSEFERVFKLLRPFATAYLLPPIPNPNGISIDLNE
jgi:hypothetical protein